MFRKQLSCSFENKVYHNYNKVSYLQKNKNAIKLINHFSEENDLFSVSWIYQKLLIDDFSNTSYCRFN